MFGLSLDTECSVLCVEDYTKRLYLCLLTCFGRDVLFEAALKLKCHGVISVGVKRRRGVCVWRGGGGLRRFRCCPVSTSGCSGSHSSSFSGTEVKEKWESCRFCGSVSMI